MVKKIYERNGRHVLGGAFKNIGWRSCELAMQFFDKAIYKFLVFIL
jgi:hypothetical protein